jgi:integrase
VPVSTREGIIVKKCSTEWHKPATNAACRARSCQHTCSRDKIERCPHAWTLRYSVGGRQREQSFRDDTDPATGRVRYGTGKGKAKDAQLKLTHDKRAQGQVFADPKAGSVNFGTAAEAHIARLAVNDRTRQSYLSNYRTHVKPAVGALTVAQVAAARDVVADLVTVTMKDYGIGARRVARMIIVGTLDEAVAAGKITGHRLAGIELFDDGPGDRKDFVFPSHAQVAAVAGGTEDEAGRELLGAGVAVWLMRGCGLRIEEALGVDKADFRSGGRTLRVCGQASRDGRDKLPLKKRKKGEYRDVPVPAWLWAIVKDLPGGPLCPGRGRRYQTYNAVWSRFRTAARAAGIPAGFTPHSLRHAFASALLGHGAPLGDVSQWLGHKDVNTTYATYRHMLPEAPVRAIAVLDAEYESWRSAA